MSEPPPSSAPPVAEKRTRRRGAICGEPVVAIGSQEAALRKPVPKTEEERARIGEAVRRNLLFAHLEDEERAELVEFMFEVLHKAGDVIIKQGDDGDNFYIMKEGKCEIFVMDAGGATQHVSSVLPGSTFGELALMYGSPRAATVKATSDCTLWAIDRLTYRRVLMDTTMKKRKDYESFLEKVPILAQCTKWERLAIADALEPACFNEGDVIVREGESGDTFYIILDGEVRVTKCQENQEVEMCRLRSADYFGEMALILNRPRAATARAVGSVKCVKLDRERFNRVLGPCEDILRRNMESYKKIMASTSTQG